MAAVHTVDARGLLCPMPVVRTRKAIDSLEVGQILEVWATDPGAPADFRAWCDTTEQKFLGLEPADGYVRIRIKKVVSETKEKSRRFPHEISNAELAALLGTGWAPAVVDVREEPEFARGHLPGALHIPIETIDDGLPGIAQDADIAVICRSARRSDYACQMLARLGFQRVRNVVPGMSAWTGPVAYGDQ